MTVGLRIGCPAKLPSRRACRRARRPPVSQPFLHLIRAPVLSGPVFLFPTPILDPRRTPPPAAPAARPSPIAAGRCGPGDLRYP